MANKINYTVVEEDDAPENDRTTEVDGHFFERRDPYGHWWCVAPVSRHLEGSFTHIDEARKAVHRHNVDKAKKPVTKE